MSDVIDSDLALLTFYSILLAVEGLSERMLRGVIVRTLTYLPLPYQFHAQGNVLTKSCR